MYIRQKDRPSRWCYDESNYAGESGHGCSQDVLEEVFGTPRYEEDFKLAAGLGSNAMRISLEWSRIEPQRGKIDEGAIQHYHAMFDCLERCSLPDNRSPSRAAPFLPAFRKAPRLFVLTGGTPSHLVILRGSHFNQAHLRYQ